MLASGELLAAGQTTILNFQHIQEKCLSAQTEATIAKRVICLEFVHVQALALHTVSHLAVFISRPMWSRFEDQRRSLYPHTQHV